MVEGFRTIVEQRFGIGLVAWEQIYSGNSRVLKLRCDGGETFVAKAYPRSGEDSRDRLGVEFGALSFLWENGIRTIPKPLYADREANIALYGFVDGAQILPGQVDVDDISAAIAFLKSLAMLRQNQTSAVLPPASEACLSYDSYPEAIHRRLQVFAGLSGQTPLHGAARSFIDEEFTPLFGRVEEAYCKSLAECGPDTSAELGLRHQTLSPSDFGFHNALRQRDGDLVFLDFEYFGWDDPAKMVGDFLHHPAMLLPPNLKTRFVEGILAVFEQDPMLSFRVDRVYAIVGLKWCLIMLNEFLPGPLARRKLAGTAVDLEQTLRLQLDKAQKKLEEVRLFFESAVNRCISREMT